MEFDRFSGILGLNESLMSLGDEFMCLSSMNNSDYLLILLSREVWKDCTCM